ncbi:Nif3-like dinuclear metal center hexameric protein [Iodobacter sp. CM08]|uniref:Nif3-like dinuclear metal center hexameric protein n=1 Tax=Iodobacter sp. CM08 TaxID=3085902 RepID=UPI0029825D66|nr:Nif3-like dinuclear metal center hexameric protein [Iodobacter sp. CM08]MDW5415483.1 Nif3-like dinuclear metal center hexameric protein [Iodobacter sp. CM08]
MPIARQDLENYIGQLLLVDSWRDYCPNGLQIEGRPEVQRIVTGVTASLALIDAAIDLNADALLVHHGFFWKGENACITRSKKARIAKLLANDINLLAYHLPLDAHPTLGNNAQLGQRLGLSETGRFGDQKLAWLGELKTATTLAEFTQQIDAQLQRSPLVIGADERIIKRVAWCTGGAQSFFHEAATLNIDCFITGEASEFVTHLANESGVSFIAAGHHATERYGIQALGQHLASQYGLEHIHLDLANPV